jgi:putative sterol carrier protein
MLPFELPAGTTLTTLITHVMPRAHAALVPASGTGETWTAIVAIDSGERFTAVVRGNDVTVREGEDRARAFWIILHAGTAQHFLDDWLGPRNYAPKFTPPGEVRWIGDPRLLKRLAMVSAKVELALTDFEGERATMIIASGAAARKALDGDDPDVVVEMAMASFTELLRGEITPDAAIAEQHVTVKGKKLVAMQLALALAPLFPARR